MIVSVTESDREHLDHVEFKGHGELHYHDPQVEDSDADKADKLQNYLNQYYRDIYDFYKNVSINCKN